MSRNTQLTVVVAAVVTAAGVGWFIGSQIRSPVELAAEAEPPEPSNITVEVVRQTLSADVITRGDVGFDDPISLSLSGSFAQQPDRLVVTESVQIGTQLAEGARVVEVVGRPVFVLAGDIPMYRDLHPGATGADVFQVEEALDRLGFFGDRPDKTWDHTTGAAVTAWYEAQGYRPNGLSEDDEEALSAARDRVRAAESALADAETALRGALEGTGHTAIVSAEAEVESAEDALELAEIDAARAIQEATEAVANAESGLGEAETSLRHAKEKLAAAEKADPPPNGEEQAQMRAAVEEAEAAVVAARETLDEAQFEESRTSIEQESFVEAASRRVEVAQAALSDASQGVDTSPLQRHVDVARTELGEHRQTWPN